MSSVHLPKLGIVAALRRKTDHKRWADPRNFYSAWEPRTERAAALVPHNSRVIEFGAGNRVLERYLHPSCTYVPSDLVERGPGTIVCDLNERPLPNLGTDRFDVAVILGVLEYLRDVPSLVDWLAGFVDRCVVSYGCPDTNDDSRRAALGTIDRLSRGWMNSYREDDLRTIFGERRFVSLHEENWVNVGGYRHRLFVFARSVGSPDDPA